MEKKIHYKMHKVKKNWVAIGVTTLALIVAPKVLGLEAGLVHADDVKQVAVQEPTALLRSEERRVGKECRSRWSPYH